MDLIHLFFVIVLSIGAAVVVANHFAEEEKSDIPQVPHYSLDQNGNRQYDTNDYQPPEAPHLHEIDMGGNNYCSSGVDTRNYLTHYDSGLKAKTVTSGRELYTLALKLCVLMDASLMDEIGFESEEIRLLIRKNWEYSSLID